MPQPECNDVTSVCIPESVLRDGRVRAAKLGLSFSGLVTKLVREALMQQTEVEGGTKPVFIASEWYERIKIHAARYNMSMRDIVEKWAQSRFRLRRRKTKEQ